MAEEKVKVTKAMVLAEIEKNLGNMVFEGAVQEIDVKNYITKTLEQLASKAEKAQLRAADKKAEGDELRKIVLDVVSDQWQTADEIFAQIDGEDLTVAKIRARLTQLVSAGLVNKESRKAGDKKLMHYILKGAASGETEAEDAE